MIEKYLKLGLVGSIIGVFTVPTAIFWFSFLIDIYSDVGEFKSIFPNLTIAVIIDWKSFFVSFISTLSILFFWTVIAFGSFMICSILLGIGFYGTHLLNKHRMTVVSLIAGVVLSPLVFIFMFLSTYLPTSSWLLNVFHYWSLAFSPNGFLFFLVQVLFTTILLIFASTLIVTREATGKPKTALVAGIIIIVWGITYITFLATINLMIIHVSPSWSVYSLIIFLPLIVPFMMITAVFISTQKMAVGVKPKVKDLEKPPTPKIRETVKGEETEKVVSCPFCGALVGKKEKKCPECGGVLL